MTMAVILAISTLILALTFTPMLVTWRRHRARSTRLRAFATEQGWRYLEKDKGLIPVRYLGTPFRTGNERTAAHVLSGTHRDREVTGFEYSYRTAGSTCQFTVVTLPLPSRGPTLELARERLAHRLRGRDLQLESDEFNAAFRIDADDDRFAYAVLHPRMMEFLLADGRSRDLPVRFERRDLLTWCGGPMSEDRLLGMADYLCDVLDRVPAHAWVSSR